jgi:hypothetical protein
MTVNVMNRRERDVHRTVECLEMTILHHRYYPLTGLPFIVENSVEQSRQTAPVDLLIRPWLLWDLMNETFWDRKSRFEVMAYVIYRYQFVSNVTLWD